MFAISVKFGGKIGFLVIFACGLRGIGGRLHFWIDNVLGKILVYQLCGSVVSVRSYGVWGKVGHMAHIGFLSFLFFLASIAMKFG